MAVVINILTKLDDAGVRKAQRSMGNLGSSAKGFSGSMGADLVRAGTALDRFGNHAVQTGKTLTYGVTVPTIALGAASVVMAGKYQSAMELIHTQAGGTVGDVEELSAAVLGMKGMQEGPQKLAASLYHLKSVGMDNVTSMDALTQSARLAAVGQADLETTTNAVASAYKSGVKGAQNFGQTAATVNAIIGAGNLRMEDLVSAMGTGFLVNAKQAGASFIDVGAAVATMTSRGIPAVRAATALKMTFSAMESPSTVARKAMDGIGMSALQLSRDLQKGGLPLAVKDLAKHLEGLSNVQKNDVLTQMFGAKSSQAILTLVGNLEDYGRVQKQIEKNATSSKFASLAASQAQSAEAKWKRLTSAVQVDAIKIGNILMPMASDLAEGIAGAADSFGNLSEGTQTTVVKLGLAAAAIGPLMMGLGYFAKGVGAPLRAIGNLNIAFSSMSAAAPLWARSIAGVAQSIGALTAAGRVGGIAAFASTLGAALGPIGLTAAALVGAGGLIYGIVKLTDSMSGATKRAADMKKAMGDLAADSSGKLQEWADKALGGHLVSKAGQITWQPAVKVSVDKTGLLGKWIKTEAAKAHTAQLEANKQLQLDQAEGSAAYFHDQVAMFENMRRASKSPSLFDESFGPQMDAAKAGLDKANGAVVRLGGALSRLKGADKTLIVRANIADARAGIDVLQKKLKGYSKQPWSTTLQAKTDKANARIAALRRYIASVTKGNHEILLQARVEGAQKRIATLQGVIKTIARSKASPEVKADRMKAAQAQLDKAKKALTALNAQRAAPVVKLVDRASDPANLLRQSLTSTFSTPITQTVVIKKISSDGQPQAFGGVYSLSSATSFVAGEAGREIAAFFPLNNPTRAASLFADLQSQIGPHLPTRSSSRAAGSAGSASWSASTAPAQVVYVGPREVTIPIYLDGQLLTSYVLNLADELEAQQSRGEA